MFTTIGTVLIILSIIISASSVFVSQSGHTKTGMRMSLVSFAIQIPALMSLMVGIQNPHSHPFLFVSNTVLLMVVSVGLVCVASQYVNLISTLQDYEQLGAQLDEKLASLAANDQRQ